MNILQKIFETANQQDWLNTDKSQVSPSSNMGDGFHDSKKVPSHSLTPVDTNIRMPCPFIAECEFYGNDDYCNHRETFETCKNYKNFRKEREDTYRFTEWEGEVRIP